MFRELRLPSSGGPRVAVAVALALVLTLELLRAWAVSMPLFYQGFLQISKPLLGLTVFSPFLVAFVAALLFGRRAEKAAVAGARVQTGATDTSSARPGSARRAGEAAVLRGLFIVVAADRIVLQFVGGGVPRMVAALVGLAACLTLLVALAPRRGVAPGLVAGLAGDTVLLMALKTESLVFRNGVAALVGAILLAGAFAAAGWWAARVERAPMRTGMPLWAWLGFGAALVVHLTITSLPAPLETATGWGAAATRVLLAASYGGAALLSFWIAGWSARAWRRRAVCSSLSLACFAVMFAGVLSGGTVWRMIAAVTLPFGLLLGLTALSALPARGLLRTRFVAAFAFVFGIGLPFVYYLGFVYRYPIDPTWLLVAAGCLFAGLLAFAVLRAFAPARGSRTAWRFEAEPGPHLERRPGTPHARWITASAVAVVMFLLVASAFAGGDGRRQSAAGALPLRMASYNIFMGLGGDVDLDLDRLAEQIARQRPDVVALQEVSRGWFTSGSVDLLPRLAERLGYSYHFFPAAGDTWGNAILTNLPSREYAQGVLPRGTSAMQRGWGGALLELADGRDMLVVVSHLHHPANGQSLRAEQAAVLVEDTLSLADRHQVLPLTVVVGDLNAEADSEELSPLRSSFLDALAHGGDPLATYPSWAPRQRIDHIFVSSGLVGTEPAVFGGLASDHLGIAVSLAPAPLPEEGPALAVGSADEGAAPATGPADAGAAVEAAGTGAGGVDPPSDAFDAQAEPVSRR